MATFTFSVRFDSEVWESLTSQEKRVWIDEVEDKINRIAYVSDIQESA